MDFQTLCLKIGRSENLPVLPTVVLNLLRLFGNEEISSKKFADTIGEDAGLTAKILRVASSPAFGTGVCENIPRAIGLIGMTRMKQIAVTLGYQQFTADKSQVPEFDKMYFWEHCKVTSSLARELMALKNSTKQDNAFMAGLMHDVGILAMEKFAPEDLARSIAHARSQTKSLEEAEQETCEYTHKMVSEDLARRWNLAPYIQDAITNQDSPANSTVDSEICNVIAVACTLANEMGYSPIRGIVSVHKSEEFLPLLDLTADQISEVVDRVKAEIEESNLSSDNQRAA